MLATLSLTPSLSPHLTHSLSLSLSLSHTHTHTHTHTPSSSWTRYKCNEAGDEVTVIPFPEGTSDCSGRSTTFGTGVWADLYKYDKSYQTDVWEDNFFSTVQPVIVLAHINNPQCAPEEDPYPCHWFPTSSKLKWNECSNRQSSKKEQFTLEGRQYKSLKWSCFKDPNSGKNPFRICGNATEPPPTARSSETDTHEYPHEDKWPSGCFIYEDHNNTQLVFNDNFESEALCTDSGDTTKSMRCLCRPPTANDAYNGYDPNEAELKAKGKKRRILCLFLFKHIFLPPSLSLSLSLSFFLVLSSSVCRRLSLLLCSCRHSQVWCSDACQMGGVGILTRTVLRDVGVAAELRSCCSWVC